MPLMTGGQAVTRALRAEGVEVVFGLPGVQIMHIYDAFFDTREVRLITTRHEQTTAYMADGYARSTGRIGVALVVPGPGLYNAGAALSTAYATSSPVMLISGQVHSEGIGRELGALHEVHDQQEAVRPVTKWRHRVTHAEEVPAAIHEAVRQLSTGRPRPVEVEILPDILAAEADVEIIEPEVYPRPAPDADAVQRAAELLAGARRPLIWSGGGVNLSGASQELQQVAELLNAPVVTTAEGHGALPYAHPLLMGAMNYSWGPGRDLVPHADVVLAVGTRFGSHRRDPAESLNPPQKLINLNVDETEFGRSYAVDVGIATDARVGLQHLAQALRGRGVQGEWDAAELAEIKSRARERIRRAAPQQLSVMDGLRQAIPEDGFVVSGVTSIGAWSTVAYPTERPRTFITSSYMGTLGFAFPTALGIKVGNPDRAVVALCGDGGFMYAVADLATAVQYGIDVVAVVFNNRQYGASKGDQDRRFGRRVIGTVLHNPDFVKLAESFGARGIRVERLEDISEAVQEAIGGQRPTVVEVEVADGALAPPYYMTQPP